MNNNMIEKVPLLPLGGSPEGGSPIRVIHGWWLTTLLTALLLLGGVMQNVSAPLWVVSLGSALGGPYVILLVSSIFYVILFAPMYLALLYFPRVPCTSPSFFKYWKMYATIGFFDGLNGIMVIYVANPNRVPPVLSVILSSVTIVFSMALTPVIVKSKRGISYMHWMPLFGIAAVLSGTMISLIPEFINLHNGREKFSGGSDAAVYTVIMILSLAPAVAYNLFQEQLLSERAVELENDPENQSAWQSQLDQTAVLFWGCLFQLLTMVLCFWVDLIPHFGASHSLHELVHGIGASFSCIFGGQGCHSNALWLGIVFNSGYSISYLASIALNKESTNYATISSTIAAPLAASFFLVFPKVLPPDSKNPPLWSVVPALAFALLGTLAWKLWETDTKICLTNDTRRPSVKGPRSIN